MKSITIQPQGNSGSSSRPYPYHIDKDGYVGRQEFWQGDPYRLLGFNIQPVAGDITLELEDFIKDPKSAEGLYPVFSNSQDDWVTHTTPIQSVRVNK